MHNVENKSIKNKNSSNKTKTTKNLNKDAYTVNFKKIVNFNKYYLWKCKIDIIKKFKMTV